jgi:transcriptional regulator with XRE-family HTH domain
MAKNFKTLQEKMPKAAQAKSQELAAKYRKEMALDELREARSMTQQHLAKILNVNQAAVSKLERRADMYISSLQAMVEAMGGKLCIRAKFPEGEVDITQFKKIGRDEEEKAHKKVALA